MPHQAAALAEADALRPLAQAIAHARIPAALKLLLLALLAAFPMTVATARRLRRPCKDWLSSPNGETDADSESALAPHVLRAFRRLRARLGWLLRCNPAEGMSLSGLRASAPCPSRAARAPP